MRTSIARYVLNAGRLLFGVGVLGFLIGSAWYYDEACPTAAWKCDLGTLGLLAVYLLPVGGVLIVVGGIAWRLGQRRQD